jgi:hypothetical protein
MICGGCARAVLLDRASSVEKARELLRAAVPEVRDIEGAQD